MPQQIKSNIQKRLFRGVVIAQKRFVRRRARRPGVFFDHFPELTPADERANGWTHGLAAVASLFAAAWLIPAAWREGDPALTAACIAYSFSLTAVMSMSALSHIVEQPRLRHLFRTLDQASIYLLTAASCSPFFLKFLTPNGWGWMNPIVWCVAIFSVWNKLRGDRVNSVAVALPIAIAWIPIIAIQPLLKHMPAGCTILLTVMAVLYMVGVIFLCLDQRRQYFHAVWHILVIMGSACTYAAIALFVL